MPAPARFVRDVDLFPTKRYYGLDQRRGEFGCIVVALFPPRQTLGAKLRRKKEKEKKEEEEEEEEEEEGTLPGVYTREVATPRMASVLSCVLCRQGCGTVKARKS